MDRPTAEAIDEDLLMSDAEWELEDMEYLGFTRVPYPERKTGVWNVYNQHSGVVLGQVRWFGRWRRYAFFPNPDTVWDERCLLAVTKFLQAQMERRKRVAAETRKAGVT